MQTLHLTIKKQWFDLVCSGEKTEEYRKESRWIEARLIGKEYDYIRFANGYGKDVPYVIVEFEGYHKNTLIKYEKTYSNGKKVVVDIGDYVIYLGKIIDSGNRVFR